MYTESNILQIDPFQTLDKDGVGQLIQYAVEQAKQIKPEIKIGVCGELGGDAKSIHQFNQWSIDYVSCSPFRVPGAILATAQSQAEKASDKVEEKNDQVLKLFIVSDSIGETAQRMIHATLTQFPDLTQVEIKKFPYIKDEQEFLNVLQLAREQNAIVATTLVSESFNALGHQFAKEHDIPYVDYMSELIRIIETHTDAKPLMESGALRKLNDEYFKRIEAIEYSVKYDDGKHFTDIGEADALIVGVSRTSKTPLSMYLANKGYKIANIPLVPEVAIPDNVFQQRAKSVWLNCKSELYCKHSSQSC